MRNEWVWKYGLLCASLCLWLCMTLSLPSSETPNQDLEKAIATLRHIQQEKMTPKEEEIKSDEFKKAWDIIKAPGKPGIQRLKQEIKTIDDKKEKDDFFKLAASALLWEIGKVDEADTIAEIWNTTSYPFYVQPVFIFLPALKAAATQDEKVLPMLKACLNCDRMSFESSRYFVPYGWPRIFEFTWGPYGSKGIPVLAEILETSKRPTEVVTSMFILSRCFYLKALPKIREMAMKEKGDKRRIAIQCLGIYQHPQDFDLLISGLKSKNPNDIYVYANALYEYGDMRAVPYLIPLLSMKDKYARLAVFNTLCILTTPASIEAIHNYYPQKKKELDEWELHQCQEAEEHVLKEINLTWDEYAKKSPQEKEKLIVDFRQKRDEEYGPLKISTHEEAVKTLEEWKKAGRISPGFKARALLPVLTLQDMNLLIDTRAALYPRDWDHNARTSDDYMNEIKDISELMQTLTKNSYSKTPGSPEKAELK